VAARRRPDAGDPVTTQPSLVIGRPRVLFEGRFADPQQRAPQLAGTAFEPAAR